MMDELTAIQCKDNEWYLIVNGNMVKIRNFVNALENTQKQAIDSILAEIGAARDGFANLLAKIKKMDGVSDELKAQIEALVLGKRADIYDPSASYSRNDFVIYDTSFYVCLSESAITGIAPSDKSKWKLLLGYERAPLPTLAGPLTANEGTTHDISLGASYDANAKYYPAVSGGNLSDLVQFTEGDYAGEWGWKWTMPTVDADTAYGIEAYSTKDGYARSYLATRSVTVIDVPVQEGQTMAIADSTSGYPGATVDADGVHAPAHSAAGDNPHQVVSAKPELTHTSGKLDISNATASGFEITENYTGPIITDKGEGEIVTSEAFGDSSTSLLDTFEGAIDNGLRLHADWEPGGNQFTPTGNDTVVSVTLKAGNSVSADARCSAAIFSDNNGVPGDNLSGYGPVVIPTANRLCEMSVPALKLTAGTKYWAIVQNTGVNYTAFWSNPYASSPPSYRASHAMVGVWAMKIKVKSPVYSATLAQALSETPTKVFKRVDPLIKLGAGVTGEYLGPKEVLSLEKGVPGENLIPTMTTTTTAGCTITASAESGYPAWQVGNKVYGNDMWIANVTAGVVTTADLTFTFSSVKTASGLRFLIGPFDGASSDYQCRTVEVFLDGVSYKTFNMGDLSTGPRTRDLVFDESKSFSSMKLRCSNSTSGKWIGSRDIEILGVGTPAPSTASALIVVGNESIKNKVMKSGGFHKTILVAGTEHEVESVSEVDNGDGSFTTTINLKNELASVPNADTEVAIPDRCKLSPAGYTYVIDGDDLKITGAEIALEDNPNLKRLAMAVSGEGLIFRAGKIYIKEKP